MKVYTNFGILPNSLLCAFASSQVKYFKFHYVSINSLRSFSERFGLSTLNSIMFLLIQGFGFSVVLCICSLNSIMFLLIPNRNFLIIIMKIKALNSIMFLLIPYANYNQSHPLISLNSIMFLLIPVPKPTAYLLHETPLFCRPLQNISFLSHSSSYVLVTPPILAIFYFCRFPAFFTLSQVDRNHYIFITSSFLLA